MTFDPDKDIPDLAGKVFLVTGGTNGIGRQALLYLAKHNPAHLYFTGRNTKSAEELLSLLKASAPGVGATFLELDLGARETIKTAMKGFTSDRLDVLIASAGIMAVPPALTADGHEVQFGTNHVGHAALLRLVLPVMLRTAAQPGADVRFVSVTSEGYSLHPPGGIAFDSLRTTQERLSSVLGARWARYGQSKLANLLYARELAARYPAIASIAVHPGVVATDLVTGLGFLDRAIIKVASPGKILPPERGADNVLWAATTDRANLVNGGYYVPIGDDKGGLRSRLYRDDGTVAAKLWEWTEKDLEGFGQ